MANAPKAHKGTSATVGYEAELWRMADALRGSMDAAEYKHVLLGLILLFLFILTTAFYELQRGLLTAGEMPLCNPYFVYIQQNSFGQIHLSHTADR